MYPSRLVLAALPEAAAHPARYAAAQGVGPRRTLGCSSIHILAQPPLPRLLVN